MWVEFVRRNHLAALRPHDAQVVAAEQALLVELKTPLSTAWAARARELHWAYQRERNQVAATLPRDIDVVRLIKRTAPCPTGATTNTGTDLPKPSGSSKSAEDFWPAKSKSEGEAGSVIAGVKISSAGCVIGKEIVVFSGSNMLDQAALDYIETVAYIPSGRDGKATEGLAPIRISFQFRD